MRMTRVSIRHTGLRRPVSFRSSVKGAHPPDLVSADPFRRSCHAFGSEVRAVRQNAGEHCGDVLRRISRPDMRELVGESGPVMHFPQKVGYFDQRVHVADFDVQFICCGRNIARTRRHDQGSGFQLDAIELSIASAISQALEIKVRYLLDFREQAAPSP